MHLDSKIFRTFAGIAASFVFAASTAACGGATSQTMTSSAQLPAARGEVRSSEGDNGNTRIDVRVQHLAEPGKIADDATVYVVWIKPRNGAPQNAGALNVDKDLEGRLDTLTPHRNFTVLVTPEPSAQVSRPSHDPVFTSDVNRD